ncbi:MAG TPA: recombinase family protein [Polyangia bacterium]|jgi:Site-specific recombinases, DNA invertase Pin homologs|nr:recombinase family protein [Polyangia bacterium]
MKSCDLPASVLDRRAIVYVRQSTMIQVEGNLESQRRQYELADRAREFGFRDIVVIDDDLGISASSTSIRPGFESLVAQICEGIVGGVFCLEASRLARNGRDWHHLLELCGLVGARVFDVDGTYDPSHPNDRLLLGLKGTMSEFELTLMRRRLLDAAVAKARRGELRFGLPVGLVWPPDGKIELDPDRRIQDTLRTLFQLFERLGSARKVLLRMHADGLLFPRPADGKRITRGQVEWRPPAYRNIISVLQNPMYAGAYVYGRSEARTTIVDGRPVKKYGHTRPQDAWTVLLREHHEGYISWEQYERNQERIQKNAYGKPAGDAKSGRGGRALLASLLRCRRCGRMLRVTYTGHRAMPRYSCNIGRTMHGTAQCIGFGATRPDLVIAHLVLDVVQPMAIEAAIVAEQQALHREDERKRALELECQQAGYEVQLARRRYEAVDPDNRLVASDLEARWNAALARLRNCESRIEAARNMPSTAPDRSCLVSLASNLETAWSAATTAMSAKQRLVRTLIHEIVVDIDEEARELILVIHWRGGHHSEHRVKKPQTGEHTKSASVEADTVIRDMATKWSDEHIAAMLNRMRLPTGQCLTWTAKRVSSHRRNHNIPGYESKTKDGRCLTMSEAAQYLGVSRYAIRSLIENGVLPARQVVKDAPWQILAADLCRPEVEQALHACDGRRHRPRRISPNQQTLQFPST